MIFQEISQSAVNPGNGVINFPEKKTRYKFSWKKTPALDTWNYSPQSSYATHSSDSHSTDGEPGLQ